MAISESTTLFQILLSDAAGGVWTDGVNVVAEGLQIPADGLVGPVARALVPFVRAYLDIQRPDVTDAVVQAYAGDRIVCQFRLLDGELRAQVVRN